MTSKRRIRPLSGVRGRVFLTVLVVTACLYSLLGSFGFLYIANNGRDAIHRRIEGVVDQLEAAMHGGTGTVSIVTPDGVEAIAFAQGPVPKYASSYVVSARTITIGANTYMLVGHASRAPLDGSLHSLFKGLWIGVPLGVLLTAAIAGLATRRALRPVSAITELAATIDARDPSTRVPVPDTDDEIEQLAITVNAMLDRIAAGRSAQRRFTSDAAHELRTPLMALQGEIELAVMESAAAGTPDVEFLERIGVLGNRLARRVDDLVMLSALDEQPPLDRRQENVLDVVRAEVASMASPAGAPDIEVVGTDTDAMIDAHLVARAVRNLVANACRHAHSSVVVHVGTETDTVVVQVDDDGPGIAEADRATALGRFGRLDEARNADTGGAGLGLAIAASVAHAHGGDLLVGTADLGGARFRLFLPAMKSDGAPFVR